MKKSSATPVWDLKRLFSASSLRIQSNMSNEWKKSNSNYKRMFCDIREYTAIYSLLKESKNKLQIMSFNDN